MNQCPIDADASMAQEFLFDCKLNYDYLSNCPLLYYIPLDSSGDGVYKAESESLMKFLQMEMEEQGWPLLHLSVEMPVHL